MHWLRRIQSLLGALFRKRQLGNDLDDEMRSHIEMQTQENIAAGMKTDEARYAAFREFDWVESIKRTCRDQRGVNWIEKFAQDVHYGARMLRKNPGFTGVAVLTLGLGIGANTAIFSIVNDLLFRPLPVKNPARLFAVSFRDEQANLTFPNISFPFYEMFRDGNRAFSDLIGYASIHPKLKEEGLNRSIPVELVSGNYFSTLGISVVVGRTFSPHQDEVPGRDSVAVISYDCWQRRFGGDTNVVGRTLMLNKQEFMIIGVTSQGFRGLNSFIAPEIWIPTAMESALNEHSVYRMVGRLRRGVTCQQAIAELDLIGQHIEEKYGKNAPPGYERYGLFRAASQKSDLLPAALGSWGPLRGGREMLRKLAALFMGAVGLVLLISCGNAANLLLVRAFKRRKEIAIRLALGASRGDLIRQLLVESILLALIGGLLGIILAHWGNYLLVSLRTGTFRLVPMDPTLDCRVLAFTMGLAVFTGLTFGLMPALQALKFDLHPALKEETPSVGAGIRRFGVRNVLVVAQVAGCLTLLLGAALCLRSFVQVASINPGFDPKNVQIASVILDGARYSSEATLSFVDQLMERVRALPGVRIVSLSDEMIPLSGSYSSMDIHQLDDYEKRGDESIEVGYSNVGPDYFRALGVPVLTGREFNLRDRAGSGGVVIVNEGFVRRYWPNQNPIGKRIMDNEVVGTVPDSHIQKLWLDPAPHVYRASLQQDLHYFSLLVKTEGNPDLFIRDLRRELQTLDKSADLSRTTTLGRVLYDSLGGQRLLMVLLGVFAALALILTTIGLYGMVAYSVVLRVREIGIRVALGARRQDIYKLVIGRGMLLVHFGLIIGVVSAFASTRVLRGFLYGVAPTDLLTFVSVPLLLAGVSLLACWLPARRAAKVDPMEALRNE